MRIRTHTNPFHYFARMQPVDFASVLPHFSGIFDFEIGFGRGLFIRHYAQMYPDRNLVGIEVRKSPVELLKTKLVANPLPNTYLIHGNAQICLEDMIPDQSLERVFVFHPDPWFKKRHQKRRVINPDFIKVLVPKLIPQAKIYLSTDVAPLWESMLETMRNAHSFLEIEDPDFWELCYKTNWQAFSDRDQRTTYWGTFQLK